MTTKYISIVILLAVQAYALANPQIDSLKAVLKTTEKSIEQIDMLNLIAEQYLATDPEEASRYAQDAIRLSKKCTYYAGLAKASNISGRYFLTRRDFEKARHHFTIAQKTYQHIENKLKVADGYTFIGYTFQAQRDYEQAKAIYTTGYEAYKELGKKKQMAGVLTNLAMIDFDLNKPDEGIKTNLKCLSIYRQLEDSLNITRTLTNIGIMYRIKHLYKEALEVILEALEISKKLKVKHLESAIFRQLGEMYALLGEYEKAIHQFQASLEIDRALGDSIRIIFSLSCLGETYLNQGSYQTALKCFNERLKISKKIGQKIDEITSTTQVGLTFAQQERHQLAVQYYKKSLDIVRAQDLDESHNAIIYHRMGNSYAKLGSYDQAIEYYLLALNLYDQGAYLEALRAEIYFDLYQSYAAQGQHSKALEYHVLHTQAQDSTFQREKIREITELETRYNVAMKERQIEKLEQTAHFEQLKNDRNQIIIYGMVGGLTLILLIAFLLIRQNRLKGKQRTLEMEQKFLRSQMNPHFIFNSLNAIQSFVYKSDIKSSAKFLARYARLMQFILDNSSKEYISLDQEIATLEHYMSLQQLRFENKFDYSLRIETELQTETIAIPPMLTQPFIENAIEHGIAHLDHKGNIEVTFRQQNERLQIDVLDNGVGRKESTTFKKVNHHAHLSIATKVTRKRLEVLNKNKRKKIKLTIEDSDRKDQSYPGTKVCFDIPFRKF